MANNEKNDGQPNEIEILRKYYPAEGESGL